MSQSISSSVGTLFVGSDARKRMEAFFKQGEMLTAERVPRGGGGVLLRDVPPLIGQGPQVILVQPRDLVEGWRHNTRKKKPKTVEGHVDTGVTQGDKGKTPRLKDKTKSLQSISISPDFSKFLDRPQEEERFRGGSRDRFAPVVDDTDILSELAARKPSWNFESILKEIEEDSVMVQSCSSSTTTESCDSLPGPHDGFIDISLEGADDADCKSPEDRKSSETQEALSRLFDQLLTDIYSHNLQPWCGQSDTPQRRRSDSILPHFNQSHLDGQLNRQLSFPGALAERKRFRLPVRCLSGIDRSSFASLTTVGPIDYLEDLEETVLCENKLKLLPLSRIEDIRFELESNVALTGKLLVVELEEKDNLMSEQHGFCEIVTASLQAISNKTSDDARVKFSLTPATHDQSGFQEWARAMRMVARLPDGVPSHFRKNLWLSLAERHLHTKGVTWAQTERRLFCDTTSAEDRELSVQIVKDLHRTGCSLFCGVTGQHNQAVLKRVLLAYARWNTNVGYCQGLNMLAALILQVMQGSQSATVKVMIYLIEGVLPESYFANNLRGLSVDMAVFRDLLRLKLPELSKHLDHLQQDSKDSGTSYEPPLCDVFTMQWFLTLFSNCLPQNTVLRVWDLVFLEGDQILLRTALAIWQSLSDRMMSVRSADEFYSIMAVLTREMMEFGLMEPNSLIKAIDNMLIPEVGELREKYIYNISPWAVGTVARMGVRLLYPDHGSPNHDDSYKDRSGEPRVTPFSNHPDREKIALDISALKRQYWKLRERQRQAHIILSACRSEGLTTGSSPALNHLLLGKRALLSAKGRRIEGSVPTQDRRRPPQSGQPRDAGASGGREGQTITWREARTRARKGGTSSRQPSPSSSSSSSSSTELCDSSDSEESGALGDADLLDKISDGEKPTSPALRSQISEPDKSRGTSPEGCFSAKTEQLSPDVLRESGDSTTNMDGGTDNIVEGFESLRVQTKLGAKEEPMSDSATATIESASSRLSSADLITVLPCEKKDVSHRISPSSSNLQSSGSDRTSHPLVMSSHTDAPSQSMLTLHEVTEQTSPCGRSTAELGLNPANIGTSLRTSPISQTGASCQTSSSYSTESASEGSTRRVDQSDAVPSSSYSNVTRLDSSELDSGLTPVACKGPKEMRKAPSSSQLGSLDVKWNRPPISSYSSIQLGVAVEPSKVPSSSLSSMQLGSGETSSTYSSLSSLPKDDTLSSDWSRKLVEESLASIADRSQKTGDSPLTSPEKSKTVEEKLKRRKSEIALLQILQENSQILQRIHQAHKITSPEEPEDIKDIRRRYGYRQSSSLDSPKTPKTTEGSPSPFIRNPSSLNREVTIKLGMYPDRT